MPTPDQFLFNEALREEFLEGGVFSSDDIAGFHRQLQANVHDVRARMGLIAHYGHAVRWSNASASTVVPHLLWCIHEDPRLAATMGPNLGIWCVLMQCDRVYPLIRDAWLAQVQQHPNDLVGLLNAAQVFDARDTQEACELADRAYRLEMDSEQAETLATLFHSLSRSVQESKRCDYLEKALALFERSLRGWTIADVMADMPPELQADPLETAGLPGLLDMHRIYDLSSLSSVAMDLNALETAEAYGNELLTTITRCLSSSGFENKRAWFDGEYHQANIVLGRVAIWRGNIEVAKEHLLAAGRVSGSPTLCSFGPNMALAKELIDLGQREVVLAYFDLCETFWKQHEHILAEWRETVLAGQVPDFGANMVY